MHELDMSMINHILDSFQTEGIPASDAVKAEQRVDSMMARLDAKIAALNHTTDTLEKRKILYDIYQIQQHADDDISSRLIAKNKPFRDFFHHTLFLQIQSEFKALGVHSLEKKHLKASIEHLSPPALEAEADQPQSFPHILANLSPETVNVLAEGLSQGLQGQALQRFLSSQDLFNETELRALSYCSFEFLGGNNSKNYKVTDSTRAYILKIENRFGRVRTTMEKLMSSERAREHFVKRYESRQATYKDPKRDRTVCNALSLEEYCPGKDLQTLSQDLRRETEPIEMLLNLSTQIANILIDLQKDDAFYTDVKPSNFLSKKKNGVTFVAISDTKSIVSSQANGTYRLTPSSTPVYTPPYRPPEYDLKNFQASTADINVGKAHAFLLGKTLYQLLTGCRSEKLNFMARNNRLWSITQPGTRVHPFEDEPIFKTNCGVKLAALIVKLVKERPTNRPTVQKVVETLNLIQAQYNAERLIGERYRTLLKNTGMDQLLPNYANPIHQANSINKVNEITRAALQKIEEKHGLYKTYLTEEIAKLEDYKIGTDDPKMAAYIETWRDKIETIPPPTYKEFKELNRLLSHLEKNHQRLSALSEDGKKIWRELELDVSVEDRAKEISEGDLKRFKALTFQYEKYKPELMQTLHKIQRYQIGDHDEHMKTFSKEWHHKIQAFPAPTAKERKQLKSILKHLAKNEDHLNKLGEKDRAQWEKAQLKRPIEARAELLTKKNFTALKTKLSELRQSEEAPSNAGPSHSPSP